MTGTDSALSFTESLLQVIRQQRHLATRVVIATQEPTISPKLLDLATMTIVHRFTSPDWMRALQSHLAGVSSMDENKRNVHTIFQKVVTLDAGEALLFAPSAMLDFEDEVDGRNVSDAKNQVVATTMGNDGFTGGGKEIEVQDEKAAVAKAPARRAKKLGMEYVKLRVRKRLTADGGRSIMAM